MAKKIYKYPLNLMGDTMLNLPIGYDILSVGNQGGKLVAWIAIDTDKKVIPVKVVGCVTGGSIPDTSKMEKEEVCQFVGTVQIGPHVAHIFEIYDWAYETTASVREESIGIP